MHNDDLPIGRVLSRREVLAIFGTVASATLLSACALPMPGGAGGAAGDGPSAAAVATTNANLAPGCVVRPELTEGPVFVEEEELNRSDIRTDPSNGAVSEGIQLDLTFRISQVDNNACAPLAGVRVDIWHCDVNGIYSDTTELGMDTVGQKFLRGYQRTDADGVAKFTTIYPGWYTGRAVHIHFKIRDEQGYDFTSQLFFDQDFTSQVYQQALYASRGEPAVKNADDGIFQASGGQLMLAVEKVDTGYAATFDVGLQLS